MIANPYCSKAAAKDAMEAVWDVCYNDTQPFDRAPWNMYLLQIFYLKWCWWYIDLQSIRNLTFLFNKNTQFFQRLSLFLLDCSISESCNTAN